MKLINKSVAAFGNGTLEPNTHIADVELADGKTLYDMYLEIRTAKSLDQIETGVVELASGRTKNEFVGILGNMHICNVEQASTSTASKPIVSDWRDLVIADSELSGEIKKNLKDAGLKTLGDIEKHTNDHSGFEVPDLGPVQQKKVIELIAQHIEAEI